MQLLVMIEDRIGETPEQTAQLPDRGDVIHFAPDDHVWGKEEVKHPFFRVIHVPDMTEVEARALLAQEPEHHETVHRARTFKLDLDKFDDLEHREFFNCNGRCCHATRGSLTIPTEVFRKAKVRKPAVRKSNVIGPLQTNVIGPK